MNEGETVRLDGGGRFGSGGQALFYRWRQTAGTPKVVLRNADTAYPSFDAPDVATDVVLTFTMTVTDADGVVQAMVVETITVRADNGAPTANAGTDRTVDGGDSVALDGSGSTDPENGTLTFAWTQTGGMPTVALDGAATALLTFTAPRPTANVDLTFRLTVTDPDGLSASDTVTITVRAPPTGTPTANAGTNRTVAGGASVTLDGRGSTDPENGTLTYAWAQTGGTPSVTLSGAATARPTFTAPNLQETTNLTFTLTVTDPDGLSASGTVTVRVRAAGDRPNVDDPPTARAGADLTVDEGDFVTLDGSGSTNPEGGFLSFEWEQTGGMPTVALTGAYTARATFTAPDLESNADLTFALTVEDLGGLLANDWVTVTVRADNDAPIARAGADRTVYVTDSVTLDGSGSANPEGGTLTFAWTQTGGMPSVTLSGASTATPTFTAPQAAAELTFSLTVTDPGGLSATDTVTLRVRPDSERPIPTEAPTVNAGADRTVYEGDSVTLAGSGNTNPEGGTLTFAWAQTGGTPSATLSGAGTATPTFTAPQVTADAMLTFTLTARDAGDNTATDSLTITVRNVRPAVSTVRTPPTGETLEPATAKSTASSWETAEYTASLGLPQINAAAGYAARTTGRPGGGGITIAIMDTRVYESHPDLDGITRVDVRTTNPTNEAHGTQVIGVAAARRDGQGMHGVAYNANIVDLQGINNARYGMDAALASAAGLTGSFSYPGHGDTYTADPAASAHIITTSRGFQSHGDAYAAAIRVAVGRGRIMVAPTGNRRGAEPDVWPARAFADEGIAGSAIAVTGLNSAGTARVSWANQCGSVRQYCLMAPAYAYTTDMPSNRQPTGQRLYRSTSGTSVASPYVAGSAAVLWAAFPNKTGRQIVDRLLTTARQIDAANCNYDATTGVSASCDHGALDLGAAMNPVGFTSLSLPGSGMVPVRGALVRLPPGARVRADPVLADAIVYDEQGFPFLHDLNGHFLASGAGASSGGVAGGFLEPDDSEWTVMPLGGEASFSFAGPGRGRPAAGPWWSRDGAEQAWWAHDSSLREPLRDYRFSFRPRAGLALTVGRGAGTPGLLNGFSALPGRWDLFRDGLSVRPFAAFAGQGLGVGGDWQLGRMSLGFAARGGRSRFGASRASLASLGLTRHFGGGLTANASWGVLRERGARLGMRSFGGFGAVSGTTNFLDVSVEKTVLGGTVLFGSYSRGTARAQAGSPGGLVQGWGEFRADALALGVEVPSVLASSDRMTATVTAPFRPRGKVAEVLVPVRETQDGVVEYALRSVDLASVGREVRAQLVYEAWNTDDTALTVGGWTRFVPDDASSAERDWGVTMKIRRDF